MSEQTWIEIPGAEFANLLPAQIIMEDRARESYTNLDQLAESIKEKGLIQPIAVQVTDDPERYRLLAGGRRFSAMILARLSPIPSRIYPSQMNELDQKEVELFENVHREDMTWQEEAKLNREIHELKTQQYGIAVGGSEEKRGHSMEDTGKLLGKDRTSVSKNIALADALDRHPELSTAKDASEARRMLKRINRTQEHATAAAEFEAELGHSEAEHDRAKFALGNAYIVKDFFEGIENVPERVASFVEIDPPYGIALDEIKKAGQETVEGYTEADTDTYPEFIRQVMKAVEPKMLSDSWIVCWYAHQYYQTVREAMEEVGFVVAPVPGFWVKPIQGQTIQPETRLGSVIEPFLYARKGKAVLKKQGRNNCFTYAPVQSGEKVHPTERPVEMIQDLIETFTISNTTVIVPFLGSGNTLLAANNAGCHSFGWDLDVNDEYRNGYVSRVQAGTLRNYRSYRA